MFYPTLKTLQWEADGMKESKEENIRGKEVANKNSVMDGEVEDITRKRSGTESNNPDEASDENYIIQHVTGKSCMYKSHHKLVH